MFSTVRGFVCATTELLTQASRLVMLDVVRIIFRRLPDLPPSVPPPESAALHPLRAGAPSIQAGNLTMQMEELASQGARQAADGGAATPEGATNGGSTAAGAAGGAQGEEEALLAGEPEMGDAADVDGLPPLGQQPPPCMIRMAQQCMRTGARQEHVLCPPGAGGGAHW